MTLVDYGQGAKRPRWPLPEEVFTSMSASEATLLQEYAADRDVLEIGSFYGYSTIAMALAGARVVAVDPHYDGPPNEPDTLPRFEANVQRHAMAGRILVARLAAQEWDREAGPEWSFDLAFVDGDHTWPQPWFDLQIVQRRLRPGGWIAVHDVQMLWPGVTRAVAQLDEARWPLVASAGSLRIYGGPR